MVLAPFNFELWLSALPVLLIAATFTWLLSLPLRNVTVIDPLGSLMLFAAGVLYGLDADPRAPRLAFVLWLLAVWALRLTISLTARSIGKGEDPHYQALRSRHEPHFRWKSLYLVFWLHAAAIWIVSLPLLGVFASNAPLGWLDYFGILLWFTGFMFEAFGWRYTRLPNYFGGVCVWWGFWCMAASAGAWWAVVGPALLSAMAYGRFRRHAAR